MTFWLQRPACPHASTSWILDIRAIHRIPRVSAGQGLGALVVHEATDVAVREEILRLVGSPYLQVVEAVFRGLYEAWAVDEVLCWNALSLGLSLCLMPRRFVPREDSPTRRTEEAEWAEALVRKHVNNLKSHTIPPLPNMLMPKDIIFMWDLVQRPLFALPFPLLTGNLATKEKLLQLTDELVHWTVQENTPAPGDRRGYRTGTPYEWNHFFVDWVARLTQFLSLEEARQHVLMPIRGIWPYAPRLTADLLAGYISYHIGFMEPPTADAQAAWREIGNWVLDSPSLAGEIRYDFLDSKIADAVSLVVFVRFGESYLKDTWPHITLFTDIIEKWVGVIGQNPSAYSYLMTMLNGPGWRFSPEPGLEWITRIVTASSDIPKLWKKNSNGERTASILLRVWNMYEDRLRSTPFLLQRYAALVDQLVAVGVPLASILQQKLES